jgi:hypothetical protein
MCSITREEPEGLEAAPGMPLAALEREITELAAHINAATCRWLALVAEFDRREGWAEWGCKSCTHWLSYRCGLSPAAAREQVRVGRKLEALPAICHAFGDGELCYSQVRAITRVATPEIEGDLVEIARHATAAQLETLMRAYRGVLEVELGGAQPAHRRRYVRCEHDDDGSLLINARLPAEEGALVLSALQAGRDALRKAGGASAETTQIGDIEEGDAQLGAGEEARGERTAVSNADALLLMSQTLIASGPSERSGADSYEVVVHVDAATLADDASGACELEGGPGLHPETARRLACDASLVRILERDGRPLSVGRRTTACRRHCGGRCARVTEHAASRVAPSGASCTLTTSTIGPGADARTSGTSFSCAAFTIIWFTRVATRSSARAEEESCSGARTVGPSKPWCGLRAVSPAS